MKQDKRIILSIIWILLGAVLIGLAFAEKVDTFWNGMGSALLIMGVLQILRFRRFNKNEDYRERVEVERNDERNRFIQNKAWAWTGYLFVLIAAVSCIVLKIAGQELLSMVAGMAVCLMVVLYWISYLILRKKY